MKLREVNVDIRSLGAMILVDVKPYKKDDVQVGYAYTVALPLHKFDKFNIKIEGSQLMEVGHEPQNVEFDNLIVHPWAVDKNEGISGTATGIRACKTKTA